MQETIVIENLTKYYNKFLALDSLTLSVGENENVGLLGPNGAGKSTTLKILCGLLRSSSGTVHVDGINVAEHPEQAIDAHEKDLAKALDERKIDKSRFWVLKFGEGRNVVP